MADKESDGESAAALAAEASYKMGIFMGIAHLRANAASLSSRKSSLTCTRSSTERKSRHAILSQKDQLSPDHADVPLGFSVVSLGVSEVQGGGHGHWEEQSLASEERNFSPFPSLAPGSHLDNIVENKAKERYKPRFRIIQDSSLSTIFSLPDFITSEVKRKGINISKEEISADVTMENVSLPGDVALSVEEQNLQEDAKEMDVDWENVV